MGEIEMIGATNRAERAVKEPAGGPKDPLAKMIALGGLIPLCHTLCLTNVKVTANLDDRGVNIESEIHCVGKTGVEMEALVAVSVALLTVYDMCKAVDKSMVIGNVVLIDKRKEALGREE